MQHGKFSYTEVYNLPIAYRLWFIKRINKEFSKNQEQVEQITDNQNSSKRFSNI